MSFWEDYKNSVRAAEFCVRQIQRTEYTDTSKNYLAMAQVHATLALAHATAAAVRPAE